MPAQTRDARITIGSGASIPAARPTTVAGDDLWAVHSADPEAGGTLDDMTAPAGWNLEDSDSVGTLVKVWHKVASGGEPAVQAFGQGGGDGVVCFVSAQSVAAATPARVAIGSNIGVTSITPDVEPAAASHLEIRATAIFAVAGSFTFAAPSGYVRDDQASEVGFSSVVSAAVCSKPVNSSSSSGAKAFGRTPGNVSLLSKSVTISVASADTEPTPDPPPAFTPARGSGRFQFVFRRMIDRQYLGHLVGLEKVAFDRRTSNIGAFDGQVPITNPKISNAIDKIIPRDPAVLTTGPGTITVEIIREGDYWGEYWVHGARIRKNRRQHPILTLRGSTLEAYLQHVRIRENLEFVDVDQIEIARQLLAHMQAQEGANIGLLLQTGSSGQLRTHTYKAVDRAPYGQRVTELGNVVDGFEWTIDTLNGATGLDRSWRWGAPTIGDPAAKHVFSENDYGGDVLDWDLEIDALRGGTHWEARGDSVQNDASSAGEPLISTLHASTAHMSAGWPRIDRIVDRPGVTRQETLEEWAAGWAARKSGAVRVFSVTVAIGRTPSFSPNNLGDPARFVMSDEWHVRTGSGAGINARHRVIGCRVVPAGRGQSKDEMDLIIESSEVA